MKILVVTQYFWPENFRINDLVRGLQDCGHEITILTGLPNYPDGSIYDDFKVNPKKFSSYHGASIVRAPIFPRGRHKFSLFLNYLSYAMSATFVGLFKLHKKNFDIVFIYEPSPITVGIPAVIIGRIFKLPVLIWVLDLWPDTLEALGIIKSQALLKIIGGLVRWIYKNCSCILSQSQGFIPKIRSYTTENKNIIYFPSWAEKNGDSIRDLGITQNFFSSNSTYIVFSGNIGDAQDFELITNAALILKNQKNIKWIIVGGGRREVWLRGRIEEYGLQECFILAGRFEIEYMKDFHKNADLLLLPLIAVEPFSLTIPAKFQTYLEARKPILAYGHGEAAQMIRDLKCGVVADGVDENALASAVKKFLLLSDAEKSAMGENSHKLSKEVFNRGRLLKKLEKLMESYVKK